MLKGHAVIELTDVNTGEKQVYEEDNLVTNAVADILQRLAPFAHAPYYSERLLPVYSKLTNGLLLFQNPLEEDVNNMAMPSPVDNPLIGYASTNAYSGTDTKRGSINTNETTALERGYKYVWDFSTSQGNGEISALALTSWRNGTAPYAVDSSSSSQNKDVTNGGVKISNSNRYHFRNIVEYDDINMVWTNLYMSNAVTLHVEKVQMCFNTIWPDSTFGTLRILNDTVIDLADCGVALNASSLWIDGEDGFYYVMHSRGSKTMNVVRFDKNTFTFDEAYGTKTFTHPYYFYCGADNSYMNHGVIIHDGYLYTMYDTYLAKFNLNDVNDTMHVTLPGGGATNISYATKRNNVFYWGAFVIFEDLSYYRKHTSNFQGFPGSAYPNDMFIFINESGAYHEFYSYNMSSEIELFKNATLAHLATINNLESPVTKTASQTMKITYTLTEVSE